MTTRVSRRSILARSAAGATFAALPTFAAIASIGDNLELLRHKPAFDRLFDEWVRLKIAFQAAHEEHEAWHQSAFGFKRRHAPDIDWGDPAWVSYHNAFQELYRSRYGIAADEPSEWDRFTDVFYPLADKILAYTATSIEGLRLQLRALISSYDNETWNPAEYDEDEPSEPWLRDFVRSACNVLDVPFPPLPEGVR